MSRIQAFKTGKNEWSSFDHWPPKGTEEMNLYLDAKSTLSPTAPQSSSGPACGSYVSDPDKPAPYSAEIRTVEGHLFMVEDQRFAWTRPDVLYYQTQPRQEDLTVAGPIDAHLEVSTSGTDSDFVVKVIDVYPANYPDPSPNPQNVHMGGFQILLAGDILRAKFRNSFSKPEPMTPDKITKLDFTLGDKYHTFLKGHRIMVQVQSSWFPMFDRNPQKFCDIYHASKADYEKAIEKIFRSGDQVSHVTLNVLKNN
jgi:uncharacterized protein